LRYLTYLFCMRSLLSSQLATIVNCVLKARVMFITARADMQSVDYIV